MKKVIQDDYVFNVDLEKSAAFYREQPIKFAGLSSYLPELTAFLKAMGIDIEKPIKYAYQDSRDLVYKVFGLVEEGSKNELYFRDDDRFAMVAFYQRNEEKEFYLEIFNLAFQLPKLSHFETGDGWVLCSLSGKFYNLKSIISTGDILNHSIFNYDELNRGLLRLIQNGYAEQSEGKFRITKKGKALIHKLSFPQSLLNGSITNMLLVDEKIVNILTEVEVNYSIDAISVDEYRKAIKAHWSFFENWLKNNK